jgi:hypothetical protein
LVVGFQQAAKAMFSWIGSRLRRLPIAALAVGLAACDFGEVGFFDLPTPAAVPAVLTIVTDDPDVPQALGWSGSAVPGAEVRLTSLALEEPLSIAGEAGADGTVELGEIPMGEYRIEVQRLLALEEREAAAGVLGFVHRGEVRVTAQGGSLEVVVPVAMPRSLVISEVKHWGDPLPSGSGVYGESKYIELYNNSDTTIFLDGKVIGQGFFPHGHFDNRPCAMFEHLRNDPAGVWSRVFEQFPGAGQDFPLEPGHTAVLALEAIDHTQLTDAPDALDLTFADFESPGVGGVTNPQVPDMIDIGLQPDPANRGLQVPWDVLFLSEPVTTEELARDREPDTGREWARIPGERILDVVSYTWDVAPGGTRQLCPQIVHASFDRRWIHTILSGEDPGMALHRRPLLTLPDGRVVLQHTRSSYADFVRAPMSPGTVLRPD